MRPNGALHVGAPGVASEVVIADVCASKSEEHTVGYLTRRAVGRAWRRRRLDDRVRRKTLRRNVLGAVMLSQSELRQGHARGASDTNASAPIASMMGVGPGPVAGTRTLESAHV